MDRKPIRLLMLLRERAWDRYATFCREYRRAAAAVDTGLVATVPSRAQLHRWLSGELKQLPYADHCRVLEGMFPGWTIHQLFATSETVSSDGTAGGARSPVPPGLVSVDPQWASGEFEAFIGAEIVTRGVTLVYPTFTLAEETFDVLRDAGVPRQHIYGKRNSPFVSSHRIDVPVAVAENDVRALIYVASMLQRHTAITFDMHDDHRVVTECDRAFISFGLSSNDCTHMYLQRSQDPLFRLVDDPGAELYLEYLQTADGASFRSDDTVNYGLIARVKPDPSRHPERYWIFCAGLGPRGTAGAGWFFAASWRELHKRAGRNDFAAVVSVQSYSDQTAVLEHVCVRSR